MNYNGSQGHGGGGQLKERLLRFALTDRFV
jgi:hypothetical protein